MDFGKWMCLIVWLVQVDMCSARCFDRMCGSEQGPGVLMMRSRSICSEGSHPPSWNGIEERKNGLWGSCMAS